MKTQIPEIIRFVNEDEILKSGVYIKCGNYYVIFTNEVSQMRRLHIMPPSRNQTATTEFVLKDEYRKCRIKFADTVLKEYAKNYLTTSKEVVDKMKTQSRRVTFETLIEIAEDRATFFVFNSEKLIQTNY